MEIARLGREAVMCLDSIEQAIGEAWISRPRPLGVIRLRVGEAAAHARKSVAVVSRIWRGRPR